MSGATRRPSGRTLEATTTRVIMAAESLNQAAKAYLAAHDNNEPPSVRAQARQRLVEALEAWRNA